MILQFNATAFQIRSAVNYVIIVNARRKGVIIMYECVQYLAPAMEAKKRGNVLYIVAEGKQ
jgi:hypothetical protein